MKILLLSNMYPSAKAPAFGTFVKTSHDALKQEGFSVERVVIDEKPQKKHQKILTYLIFYFRALYVLLFNKYDFIYAHYVSHVSLPLVVAHFLGKKLRVIAHVHGGDVKQLSGTSSAFFKIKQYLSAKVLRLAERIVSPSKSYAKFVSSVYAEPIDKFSIYPSGGVNQHTFSMKETIRRTNVVGYAGRLIPSKNVDIIIQAMLNNNVQLEIVGSGIEEKNLKQLVNTLDLGDRVTFIQPKNHDELAEWFRSIDCLLYPSSSESLGLVPIEAMACGAHVILSDIPAFRELFDAKLDVTLLPEISSQSLATAVDKLANQAPKTIKSRYDNAQDTLAIYGEESVRQQLIKLFK